MGDHVIKWGHSNWDTYTELNDGNISCLRKYEVSVERISVCNVIKIWRSMAHTVCHAPMPVTS